MRLKVGVTKRVREGESKNKRDCVRMCLRERRDGWIERERERKRERCHLWKKKIKRARPFCQAATKVEECYKK